MSVVRLVCIDNYEVISDNVYDLTIGKVYSVVIEELDIIWCHLIDDNGKERTYFHDMFITISEYRKQKLEKLDNFIGLGRIDNGG